VFVFKKQSIIIYTMNKYLKFVAVCAIGAAIFSGCSKEHSFEKSTNPQNTVATGSLKDASGNCLPMTIHGTLYDGIAPGDTNYLEINVNVTAVGTYTIHTDVQNGLQFSGSGVFTDTGVTTINLKALGTPLVNEPTTLIVTLDLSSCPILVNVQDSTGTGLGGNGGTTGTDTMTLNTWKFTTNGHTYNGSVSAAQFITAIGGNLTIVGTMQSGATDTAFGLTVQFPGSTLDAGTYPTSDAGTNFSLQKIPSGDIIYAANAVDSPPVLSITISSYNSTTKIVSGTFSGEAYDFPGNTVTVTNGAFKAQLP
jgi:hypothetical protein